VLEVATAKLGPATELLSTEAAPEVRRSAEVSTAEMGSAAHSATAAPVRALGQRTCRHRGRAKRDRRRGNKYYLTHEPSSLGDAAVRMMRV
jgi:hypothetical protein